MRAYSMQAIARGADGVMFFQWRQSVAGAERFHSGMLPHFGAESRVFKSIAALGAELPGLDSVVGEKNAASVAIVFEWDSWWSLEQPAVPAAISYVDEVFAWYRRFWARNLVVDFVRADDDLTAYPLVIVPSLFSATPSSLQNLGSVAVAGAQLVVTFQTGVVDANSRISEGGYLGPLADVLGIRVEEFAPFAAPGLRGPSSVDSPLGSIRGDVTGVDHVRTWAEFLHVIDADIMATFVGDSLDNWPAVTRRASQAGFGAAWYVATVLGDNSLDRLIQRLIDDAKIADKAIAAPEGVEVVLRGSSRFSINHTDQPVVQFDETIPARGVLVEKR